MMTLQAINSSLKTAKKINQNYSQNLIHILHCIKDNVFTFFIVYTRNGPLSAFCKPENVSIHLLGFYNVEGSVP